MTLNEGQEKHPLVEVLKVDITYERNGFFLMVKVVISLLGYLIANIQERR